MKPNPTPRENSGPGNFVEEIIDRDLRENKHGGRVVTRFPPEPNGYLHVGHAKSICLNFGMAVKTPGGVCNLRFDDTNPGTEEPGYVTAIKEDVRWLGFDWGTREYFASDYFEKLFEYAVELIKRGKAYVDSQTEEEIRAGRGDFYRKGTSSPYRNRSVEESSSLFSRMQNGEFEEGAHVLRAKIDMESKDVKMRDPIIYRIRKEPHYRTGSRWRIYPMYDFAHGLSDSIEGVTHSLCTLEFQNHRALYHWFLDELGVEPHPEQIEFARLNLTYTVLSKRKLQELVEGGHVSGWDDPRMPTLAGMRRLGYTAEAIRSFCDRIGVAKRDGVVDVSLLEHALREDLNARCPRVMGVLRPLKVVIENFPEGAVEEFGVPNHPEHPERGTRKVPFSRELYIDREDFLEDPPKKWFRLAPQREVRLRSACLVTCVDVKKDEGTGEVVELRCTWDPRSRGGASPDGRRVQGTLHWVSAAHSVRAQVRLYDRLFLEENPLEDESADFTAFLNPHSLELLDSCQVEPSLANTQPGALYQFERVGYFCVDPLDSRPGSPVFNRTISLKDTWAKLQR